MARARRARASRPRWGQHAPHRTTCPTLSAPWLPLPRPHDGLGSLLLCTCLPLQAWDAWAPRAQRSVDLGPTGTRGLSGRASASYGGPRHPTTRVVAAPHEAMVQYWGAEGTHARQWPLRRGGAGPPTGLDPVLQGHDGPPLYMDVWTETALCLKGRVFLPSCLVQHG
jgi:hypothetical protein